jgi:hypothetical protein
MKIMELSPDEVRVLRRKVLTRSHAAINALGDIAEGLVDPSRKDTMARVAAARVLLSKVLPELSASFAETHVHHHHDVGKMSKAQLQAILATNVIANDKTSKPKALINQGFSDGSFIDVPENVPNFEPASASASAQTGGAAPATPPTAFADE